MKLKRVETSRDHSECLTSPFTLGNDIHVFIYSSPLSAMLFPLKSLIHVAAADPRNIPTTYFHSYSSGLKHSAIRTSFLSLALDFPFQFDPSFPWTTLKQLLSFLGFPLHSPTPPTSRESVFPTELFAILNLEGRMWHLNRHCVVAISKGWTGIITNAPWDNTFLPSRRGLAA